MKHFREIAPEWKGEVPPLATLKVGYTLQSKQKRFKRGWNRSRNGFKEKWSY